MQATNVRTGKRSNAARMQTKARKQIRAIKYQTASSKAGK